MYEHALQVEGLTKAFAGRTVVDDLSFDVKSGEIFGFLGPNGSGKTTTIRMALGIIRPDKGSVSILGALSELSLLRKIGYLPEEAGLPPKARVMDTIRYLGRLKGMSHADAESRANELLTRVGLHEHRFKKVDTLSQGMKQMIQFIVALVHRPRFLILDEPFSGLDPVNTELLKRVVDDLRSEGRAIILSTHQMNQVEELCDRVLMIHHGSAVLYGDIKEAAARFRRKSVLVEIEGDLGSIPGVAETKPNRGGLELVLTEGTTPMMILDRLRERSIVINRFEIATPSLHEIFIQLVGAEHE
jgi:ABC-2 type transport system ATP-binding protein